MSHNETTATPKPMALRLLDESTVRKHWRLFLIEGIVLVVGGCVAIALPWAASLAFTIFLGWLFLIVGGVGLATSLLMRPRATGFWWSMVSAAASIGAGVLFLGWPMSGLVSLTLLLTVFFFVDGAASIFYAVEHKKALSRRWEWMLASGILDFGLGAILLIGFPLTALWALGLIVGIDMVFGGAALSGMALRAHGAAASAPVGQEAPHAG